MSEIKSIANGTYTIGQTSALNFEAGPGISITEPSAGTVRIGNDETVLWDNTVGTQSGCTLSESITNFERILISYGNGNGRQIMQVDPRLCSGGTNVPLTTIPTFSNGYASIYTQSWKFNNNTTFVSSFKAKECYGNTATVGIRDTGNQYVYGLTGINRISGGNE